MAAMLRKVLLAGCGAAWIWFLVDGGTSSFLFALFISGVIIVGKIRERDAKWNEEAEEEKRKAEHDAAIARERAREQADRDRLEHEHRSWQAAIKESTRTLAERVELLAKHTEDANGHVLAALNDFDDGAFAPFWDSVERAAMSLGVAEEDVRQCDAAVRALLEILDGEPPHDDVNELTSKMTRNAQKIVGLASSVRVLERRANRKIEFAQIYQLRRTNQILVSRFDSLTNAVERTNSAVMAGAGRLYDAISSIDGTIRDEMAYLREQIADSMDRCSGILEVGFVDLGAANRELSRIGEVSADQLTRQNLMASPARLGAERNARCPGCKNRWTRWTVIDSGSFSFSTLLGRDTRQFEWQCADCLHRYPFSEAEDVSIRND